MRALWIEDHQLVGDSLEVLLHVVMPTMSLDKARDLEAAKRLLQTFQYELILLDWWIGTTDGEGAIRAFREAGSQVPVIVVSGDDRELVMRRALELGAVGYVPKTADPATLVDAIRTALKGGVTWPRYGPRSSTHQSDNAFPPINVEAVFPELTPRQADVFRALMRGLSDKQIGRDLGVSDTTIKSHVRAILQIVGVRKRGEAAYQARVRGAGDR